MKLLDSELIEKLKDMVKNERELLTEILRHLREVERRRLFLERGYSSLFAFCTEALGYSEAEAHVRIQAMRLMSAVPMVEQKIESGELSLSVAAKVQSNFRKAGTPVQEKAEIVESVLGKSVRQAERELAERFPEIQKPEVARSVAGGQTRLEFTISNACLEKLKRLKERTAHKNFDGRMDVLFEDLVDMALEKIEKVAGPKNSLGTCEVNVKRSRYISSSARQEVWFRAGGQCQFHDASTGHRCASRYGLQVDHIKEFAKGGSSAIENLQLLCGAHNRWRSCATG